jgi:asperthecin polyketide synthase
MDTPSSTSQEAVQDFTTKVIYFGSEFPGDDLKDLFRRLQRQSKDKRFRCLATFLAECTEVIKEEIQKLPQPLQDLLRPFQTAASLADYQEDSQFRRGPLGGALESALLCILHISMFIG